MANLLEYLNTKNQGSDAAIINALTAKNPNAQGANPAGRAIQGKPPPSPALPAGGGLLGGTGQNPAKNLGLLPPPSAPQPGAPTATGFPIASAPSLPAAQYPNSDSISNLGNYPHAQDVASRTQAALGVANNPGRSLLDVAAGGQQPSPVFAGNSQQTGIAVAGKPTYETGYYDQAGNQIANIAGPNQRQGGGTLSFLGGPSQEQQAATAQTVSGINSQIAALRGLREARNPGVTQQGGSLLAGAVPEPVDLFARPGDGFGDSQLRKAQFESLVNEAGGLQGVGVGNRRRGEGLLKSANALLAPGLEAAKAQADQYASRNSLAGQLAKVGADQSAEQQRAREAAARLGIDQQHLLIDQQRAGLEQEKLQQAGVLSAANTFKAMTQAQQQDAKNQLFNEIRTAKDQNTRDQLVKLYELINRDQQPIDPLAAFSQRNG